MRDHATIPILLAAVLALAGCEPSATPDDAIGPVEATPGNVGVEGDDATPSGSAPADPLTTDGLLDLYGAPTDGEADDAALAPAAPEHETVAVDARVAAARAALERLGTARASRATAAGELHDRIASAHLAPFAAATDGIDPDDGGVGEKLGRLANTHEAIAKAMAVRNAKITELFDRVAELHARAAATLPGDATDARFPARRAALETAASDAERFIAGLDGYLALLEREHARVDELAGAVGDAGDDPDARFRALRSVHAAVADEIAEKDRFIQQLQIHVDQLGISVREGG